MFEKISIKFSVLSFPIHSSSVVISFLSCSWLKLHLISCLSSNVNKRYYERAWRGARSKLLLSYCFWKTIYLRCVLSSWLCLSNYYNFSSSLPWTLGRDLGKPGSGPEESVSELKISLMQHPQPKLPLTYLSANSSALWRAYTCLAAWPARPKLARALFSPVY